MNEQEPYEVSTENSRFLWCLHCEAVAARERWEAVRRCPGCGAGWGDAWPWARIREVNPDYPEVPAEGELYPQWGREPAV